MKKYSSLMKRYPDQRFEEIFAHFPYDGANGETWETPYQHLAENVAKKEEWHFNKPESAKYKAPDWTFFTFADSYSTKLAPYKPLPDLPTYIKDPADLVFDTKLDIEINTEHIVEENKDRLPAVLQTNRRLAMTSIAGAIESLKAKVVRNYKVAIPHWYEGHVQLLLPLNLTDDHIADLALVVDKDKERNIYRAVTILTMDLAYIDARLITRPDRDWLNP
jgi:hypothetical protein